MTTKTEEVPNPYRTTYHRDGTVTVWDVYTQSWLRTAQPSDKVLASLSPKERERVKEHCEKFSTGEQSGVLAAETRKDEFDSERVLVTDLRCGDLFIFRDVRYVAMACVYNEGTPDIAIIVAGSFEKRNVVTTLGLYHKFKVVRFGRADLQLENLDNSEEEVLAAAKEAREERRKSKEQL